MTDALYPDLRFDESGDCPHKWANLIAIGLLLLVLYNSLHSWLEETKRKFHRSQLRDAYQKRSDWKKSDAKRLEALGVSAVAKRRMQRLRGCGRPTVRAPQRFEDVIEAAIVLIAPISSREDRRRCFKQVPCWREFVESYYRGELALARQQGLASPASVAESRIGAALHMSESSVHAGLL
jgi:hypothetical protein